MGKTTDLTTLQVTVTQGPHQIRLLFKSAVSSILSRTLVERKCFVQKRVEAAATTLNIEKIY